MLRSKQAGGIAPLEFAQVAAKARFRFGHIQCQRAIPRPRDVVAQLLLVGVKGSVLDIVILKESVMVK